MTKRDAVFVACTSMIKSVTPETARKVALALEMLLMSADDGRDILFAAEVERISDYVRMCAKGRGTSPPMETLLSNAQRLVDHLRDGHDDERLK